MVRMSRRMSAISALGACLLLTATPVTPAAATQYTKILNVTPQVQVQSNWCWAASNGMILSYVYGILFTQCAQANSALGRSDCCGSSIPSACNVGRTIDQVKAIDAARGISTTIYNSALSFGSVKSQIDTYRPMYVVLNRGVGSYHAVVLRGYDWMTGVNGWQTVYDIDPIGGNKVEFDYSYFVSHTGWTWSQTLTYR